jgi:AAA domain, putative AbiEii toxin, Type IV TA system
VRRGGYHVELEGIPVATENVFFDYNESRPATVRFRISNGNELILFFPERGACYLHCNTKTKTVRSSSQFMNQYNVPVGFVPILGPVEHEEPLYQRDAARLALLTHRAARNFRNIWYHYPDNFDEFRNLVKATWPGMDIQKPEVDHSGNEAILHMFCPEERIPREIFWSGFGFQVWCQMLTFMMQNKESSLFIIDEPDIYLHSDLQRQLLDLLKNLGPDILIATHSTEIITEADPDDLIVINKKFQSAKRIKDPNQLQGIFQVLGSNLNPVLTQLAKTKRVLFVEGKDFQILSHFARKLGKNQVATRSEFAVVPLDGFNPAKIKDLVHGIEITLGTKILVGAIFDRDYRSDIECKKIIADLRKHCTFAHIHERKELENFLLYPEAIARAIQGRRIEHEKRTAKPIKFDENVSTLLLTLTEPMKHKVQSRYLGRRLQFQKSQTPGVDESTITEQLMTQYEAEWGRFQERLTLVPGKEVLAALNSHLQQNYGITVTSSSIIDSFVRSEIPKDMLTLVEQIDQFRKEVVD